MIDKSAVRDLPRITMGVLAILVLIVAAGWVVLPFLAATVWAAMIVMATWPMLLRLQRLLGGRRGPAVAVMVLLLVAILVAPIWIGIATIGDNVVALVDPAKALLKDGLPPPPAWLSGLPVVGKEIAAQWSAAAADPVAFSNRVQPYLAAAAKWLAAEAGKLGSAVVQLVLTVVAAGILYASGESAGLAVTRFLRRLAGDQGEKVAQLAAKAVRAVALGIVVTALAQTILSSAGLLLARVPHAGPISAVIFVLCIAQLGPILAMGPVAVWLYANGSPGRATVAVVFTLLAMTLDNLVRPVLIKKGADLPLLLIMTGVIGGLLAFGILGLFIGPVVLAVAWTLASSWVAEQDVKAPPAPVDPPGAA